MFFDIDTRRAKNMAKALKKALPAGAGLNYQQCLDLVARQLAGTTFDALKPRLEAAGPDASPGDTDPDSLVRHLEDAGQAPLAVLPLDHIASTNACSDAGARRIAQRVRALLSGDAEPERADVAGALEGVQTHLDALIRALDDGGQAAPSAAPNPADDPDAPTVSRTVPPHALDVELFDIPQRPVWCLAAAHTLLPNLDPGAALYLHYIPSAGREDTIAVQVQDANGPVAPSELDATTARAVLHFQQSEELRDELADLCRTHTYADGPMVLAFVGIDTGLLFPFDVPEHGYGDDRVGLLLATDPGTPHYVRHRGEAEAALARRWGWWLQHDPAIDAPDYQGDAIVAEVFDGPLKATPQRRVDITDLVLAPDRPASATRALLCDGWTRWPFSGTSVPEGRQVYLRVRASAAGFFRKPVDRIDTHDLMAARRARGQMRA